MSVQYKYQAVTSSGQKRSGLITAQNPDEVVELLNDLNLIPVRVTPSSDRSGLMIFGFLNRTDYEKLIMFTSSLSTMYKAGIPLLRSLTIIRVGKPDGHFNHVIDQLRTAIQSGRAMSDAMADFPLIFSSVYVASVAAGEESGKLEFILDELAGMLEQEMELTRQIKAAIRYPLIVTGIIIGALVVLTTFVIPRFVSFYSSFDATLPLPTRIIIGMSEFSTHYWPVIIVFLIMLVLGFRKAFATTKGRFWIDRKLLQLPIFGELMIKGNVARFALMFKLLFASGITIVRSLEVLASTVKNVVIASEIRTLEAFFRRGKDIDDIREEVEFFPPQALQMMAVGLESGNLDRMLREIGAHYMQQVLYTSRMLTSILEPILTVVLGLFVLIMALGIFLPMWSLLEVFRR